MTVVRDPPPGNGSYLRALSRSAPPSSASLNSTVPSASVNVSSQRPSQRGMRAVTVMPPLVREAWEPSSAMTMVGAGASAGGGSRAQSASAIGCMKRARTRMLFAPHGSMRTVSPSPTQVRAPSAAVNGEVMVMGSSFAVLGGMRPRVYAVGAMLLRRDARDAFPVVT